MQKCAVYVNILLDFKIAIALNNKMSSGISFLEK